MKRVKKSKRPLKAMACVPFIALAIILASCKTAEEPAEDTVEAPPLQSEVTVYEEPEDTTEVIYDPYSAMSLDWDASVYEEGFVYYEIPEEYTRAGGYFPEVAQVYLWCICRDAGVDYYTVLALIERESGYKYDSTGDSGNSKGLMQIYEYYHLDRMEEVGATDLYNPYDNMRVGVNFLAEIQDKYLASSGENCVLMVYNMGATTAKKYWEQGTYSTDYTRGILQRAQEIQQELQEE